MRFSNPQYSSAECKAKCLDADPRLSVSGENSDIVRRVCEKVGLQCFDEGNIHLEGTFDLSREMTYIEQSRQTTAERYKISVSDGDAVSVSIRYSGERGLYYALSELKRQLDDGYIILGDIEDYPLFSRRGYIEGFYGNPWSFEERSQMLHLMSSHRMNTYFFAPKDDEYHREKWDSLYPESELDGLRKIERLARECYVDFWFCISPGLNMRYSDDGQFYRLRAKLLQLYSIGIKRFGLLLDDIPQELQYPQDIERFGGEIVRAHIYIANRLYDELKSIDNEIELTVCPMQYHGRGDEYFISTLGQNLEPDINLFWTGRNICSQELTAEQASCFIRSTRHKPLYWDNFPVNDAEMYNEMHLGYICGREPELYRYCAGLISNCMEFSESSKIPLLTVADYLWNPVAYNPDTSWDYALKTVVGDEWETFKLFADNLLTSCLKADNSVLLCQALGGARSAYMCGEQQRAVEIFSDYLEKMRRCRELLLARKGDKLYSELWRWAEKFFVCTELLELCLECLTSPGAEVTEKTAAKLKQYLQMPETLADFCLRETAEFIIGRN